MSEETTKPQRSEAPGSADAQGLKPGFRADKDAPEGGARFKSKRRRKVSYLTINKIDTVDYKEINILRRFLNERGKILPARQSGNTAKQQRMIAEAIRRAREMALLPFVVTEMGTDRREYGGRRERTGYDRDRGGYDRGDRGDRNGDRNERTDRTERPAAPAAEAPAAEAPAE